jgi:hypothetical protein
MFEQELRKLTNCFHFQVENELRSLWEMKGPPPCLGLLVAEPRFEKSSYHEFRMDSCFVPVSGNNMTELIEQRTKRCGEGSFFLYTFFLVRRGKKWIHPAERKRLMGAGTQFKCP